MRPNERGATPHEAIMLRVRFLASRGTPFHANPATIRLLRARRHPDFQYHVAELVDESGQPWYLRCLLRRAMDGRWYVKSMGAGPGPYPVSHGKAPVARLGSSTTGDVPPLQVFYGDIGGDGDVARVRLLSHNGIAIEDAVEDGLVLFESEQDIEPPLRAEIYDRSGRLVARHPAL